MAVTARMRTGRTRPCDAGSVESGLDSSQANRMRPRCRSIQRLLINRRSERTARIPVPSPAGHEPVGLRPARSAARVGLQKLSEMVRQPVPDRPGAPSLAIDSERPARPRDMTTATKVRLRFAKCGDLRLVSHHDLLRCLERMLRRAQVPMAMSQGSTRAPRSSSPWPWGWGSRAVGRSWSWSWPSRWSRPRFWTGSPRWPRPASTGSTPRAVAARRAAPRPEAVAVPVPGPRRAARRGPTAALAALLAGRTTWPDDPAPHAIATSPFDLRPYVVARPSCRTTACSASAEDIPRRLRPARGGDRRPRPARPAGTGPSWLAPKWISNVIATRPADHPPAASDRPDRPPAVRSTRHGLASTAPTSAAAAAPTSMDSD